MGLGLDGATVYGDQGHHMPRKSPRRDFLVAKNGACCAIKALSTACSDHVMGCVQCDVMLRSKIAVRQQNVCVWRLCEPHDPFGSQLCTLAFMVDGALLNGAG